MNKFMEDWILPIEGLRRAWTGSPESLLLCLPFLILVAIHPVFLVLPITILWFVCQVWRE